MAVIDGVFCVGRACYRQTRDAFQSSRLTGVRLWAVIALQTVWWEIGGRSSIAWMIKSSWYYSRNIGGTFVIMSPSPNIGGGVSPPLSHRDRRPCEVGSRECTQIIAHWPRIVSFNSSAEDVWSKISAERLNTFTCRLTHWRLIYRLHRNNRPPA